MKVRVGLVVAVVVVVVVGEVVEVDVGVDVGDVRMHLLKLPSKLVRYPSKAAFSSSETVEVKQPVFKT